ncbi:MAG TPA: hypothetical protein PKA09_25270 [Geminicoccus sp.]|nr:hypothetical protein [Geminicoccus sp.]
MLRHGLAAALGGVLFWSAAADAAVLLSPPLVAEGSRVLDCYLVNVGSVARSVKIEVLNRAGTVVKTVNTTLDPFEEDVARTTSAQQGRVCRFTVPGDKNQYRASILVRQNGVGAISALAAF